MRHWKIPLAGVALALTTLWYLPWVFRNLNWRAPWLSIPFATASVLMAVMTLITIANHWRYSRPPTRLAPAGQEPRVVVIVPTYGEPAYMVLRTVQSILEQDYPQERITVIISDDGYSNTMEAAYLRLLGLFPQAHIGYYRPPKKGDPRRRGDAKAGNLNAVLDLLCEHEPEVEFIETRDADDLVSDPSFLRQCIGQLMAEPRVAFVQTIKEAVVSAGDPFGNLEPLFYRRAMLAKNAANAVFPCGSGLVWRREALEQIGGFPTWNLVEDLQSGVEALRRGWIGIYLPIVGAVGQTAPEDLPNMIKQRGTWALDTMRITFWGNRRGLSFWQNLQFSELGFFYMLSLAVLVFILIPLCTLTLDIYPLITTQREYAVRFWIYALAIESMLVSLADGLPYEALWRSRQTWLGMAPIYAKATLLALAYGPRRKPSYKVTRKEHVHAWHWQAALPQFILFMALVSASVYHLFTHSLFLTADLGSLFWAGFFMLSLSRTIVNSWHGLKWGAAIRRRMPRGLRRLGS